AMAVLTFLDLITPPLLLGLGLVIGVGVAFNLPSWQAIVPNLVPRGMLASAVALNSAGFNVARAVGPALAGVVFATFGAAVASGQAAVSVGPHFARLQRRPGRRAGARRCRVRHVRGGGGVRGKRRLLQRGDPGGRFGGPQPRPPRARAGASLLGDRPRVALRPLHAELRPPACIGRRLRRLLGGD